MPLSSDEISALLAQGVIDAPAAERLRAHYAGAARGGSRLVALALGLGGVAIGAGMLLFVAANWDAMSPGARFALVVAMVGALHAAGAALAARHDALATLFHGLGTVALGAGIYLTGQIFNLQAHWPAAVLLWAVGALAAWALRRDWVQAAFAALLVPGWIASEAMVRLEERLPRRFVEESLAIFLVMLAFAYLGATRPGSEPLARRVLARLGAVALLPAVLLLGATIEDAARHPVLAPSASLLPLGALALPLAFGALLRGRGAWPLVVAAVWVMLLVYVLGHARGDGGGVLAHLLGAAGAVGVVTWGLREREAPRINVGVAGFVLAVGLFYFSSVMDRIGRSLGLIGLGVLLVGGGLMVERLRRRLLARIDAAEPA